jgi:hypothetical protein
VAPLTHEKSITSGKWSLQTRECHDINTSQRAGTCAHARQGIERQECTTQHACARAQIKTGNLIAVAPLRHVRGNMGVRGVQPPEQLLVSHLYVFVHSCICEFVKV